MFTFGKRSDKSDANDTEFVPKYAIRIGTSASEACLVPVGGKESIRVSILLRGIPTLATFVNQCTFGKDDCVH